MPNPLIPEPQGAFTSFLDWLGRPTQVVKNLITGDTEGAWRQGVDFVGDIGDAFLPGDWIPHIAKPEDFKSVSHDILGMEEGATGETVANIAGDIILDPLTWFGGPAIKGAVGGAKYLGGAAKAGIEKIPGGANALIGAGKIAQPIMADVRSAFGAQRFTEPGRAVADAGEIAQAQESTLGTALISEKLGHVDPEILRKAQHLFNDVNPDTMTEFGVRSQSAFVTPEQQMALIAKRLEMTGWDQATKDAVAEAAGITNREILNPAFKRATDQGILFRPQVYMDEAGNAIPKQQLLEADPNFMGPAVLPHRREPFAATTALHEQNLGSYERALGKLGPKIAQAEQRLSQVRPLHETMLTKWTAAQKTSDELLDVLPDLKQRKRAFDAIEEKVGKMQSVANALGRLEKQSGTRQVNLQNQLNTANDSIARYKQTFADLKEAMVSETDPALLENLREVARAASKDAGAKLGDLISVAKTGEFGSLAASHAGWTAAKQEARLARKAVDDARLAGVDEAEVARLLAIHKSLAIEAEKAKDALRYIRPKVSESSRADEMISVPAVRERGKLREMRDLMDQLDDPDIARYAQMERQQAKAGGAAGAYETMAGQVGRRVEREQGVLDDLTEKQRALQQGIENMGPAPTFDEWAADHGYTLQQLPENMSPPDYFPRFAEMDDAAKAEFGGGLPGLTHARKVGLGQEWIDDLARRKATPEEPVESLNRYFQNFATASGKAKIAREVPKVLDEFGIKAPAFNSLAEGLGEVKSSLEEMTRYAKETGNIEALDTAKVLTDMLKGMPPREGVYKILAGGNSIFKKAAVYGFVVPKVGSAIRNNLSGVIQTAAESGLKDAGKVAIQMPGNLWRAIGGAVDKTFGTSMVADDFLMAEQALKQAGGDMTRWVGGIDSPMMREFVQGGGFQGGFVTSEELVDATMKHGWRKWLQKMGDLPGEMWRGGEQQMRYGAFKNLREAGMETDRALRLVNDTFYHYGYRGSELNRKVRDWIPFFQFQAKAIPQMAKWMAKNPAIATSIGAVYNQSRESPVYPYMQGKTNIPMGESSEGDQVYATGMGFPWESLGMIPNLSADIGVAGRQTMQNVVGASQPLAKTAVSIVGGRDPYFESPYGSYSKLPGNIEGGAVGQAYNKLAGTGLIQPFSSMAQSVGTMIDSRKTTSDKLIDMLTGANVAVVDEDRALQQIIEDYLKRNPDVKQFSSFYQTSDDPKAKAFLDSLKDAKKRLKSKKKAKDILTTGAPSN